jgi:hypothetical protein
MNMAKLTTRQINAAIKKLGGEEILVRGDGYWYFTEGNADQWDESGVYGVNFLYQMPLERWIAEYTSRRDQFEASRK